LIVAHNDVSVAERYRKIICAKRKEKRGWKDERDVKTVEDALGN